MAINLYQGIDRKLKKNSLDHIERRNKLKESIDSISLFFLCELLVKIFNRDVSQYSIITCDFSK